MNVGKVIRINGPIVRAAGLGGSGLYDVVEIGEKRLIGEIIRLEGDTATIQVYEDNTGMRIGERAVSLERPLSVHLGPGTARPDLRRHPAAAARDQEVRGRLHRAGHQDPPAGHGPEMAVHAVREGRRRRRPRDGPRHGAGDADRAPQGARAPRHRSFDDRVDRGRGGLRPHAARGAPRRRRRVPHGALVARAQGPALRRKLPMDEPLITGQRVIDVFFPISRGGTAAIPGGFGTGKTMTQHALAKWCDADIIVYIGCGERGNEMTDVLTSFPELDRPAIGPQPHGAHDPDREHLEHARGGTGGVDLHGRDARRVLPGHGLRRGHHGGLHLPVGRGAAGALGTARGDARGRGVPRVPAHAPRRVLRAGGEGEDPRRRARPRSRSSARSRRPAAISRSPSRSTPSGSSAASGRSTATWPTPGTTRPSPGSTPTASTRRRSGRGGRR